MNGHVEVTHHALERFRKRFGDPDARVLDVGRMIADAKIDCYERRKDATFVLAVLDPAVFVLRLLRPGRWRLITVFHINDHLRRRQRAVSA